MSSFINGYSIVYQPHHHRAMSNGMVYEHMLKAEEKLGRLLKDEEVVHHNDHNRSNNSIDNLTIFATIADHSSFHNGGEIYYQDNIAYAKKKEYFCSICGAQIREKSASMCVSCNYFSKRTVERPSREKLKELIRTTSFTRIGALFGVSDNAIRKWCDTENLPRKVTEIKKISDEEWEFI